MKIQMQEIIYDWKSLDLIKLKQENEILTIFDYHKTCYRASIKELPVGTLTDANN